VENRPTSLQWQGQQLLAGNAQVAELAGLLYGRGIRGMRVEPGLSGDHVLALFGVALGLLPRTTRAWGRSR